MVTSLCVCHLALLFFPLSLIHARARCVRVYLCRCNSCVLFWFVLFCSRFFFAIASNAFIYCWYWRLIFSVECVQLSLSHPSHIKLFLLSQEMNCVIHLRLIGFTQLHNFMLCERTLIIHCDRACQTLPWTRFEILFLKSQKVGSSVIFVIGSTCFYDDEKEIFS